MCDVLRLSCCLLVLQPPHGCVAPDKLEVSHASVVLRSSKERSGLPSALALREDGLGMLACQESRPQHPLCVPQETKRLKYCTPTYVTSCAAIILYAAAIWTAKA